MWSYGYVLQESRTLRGYDYSSGHLALRAVHLHMCGKFSVCDAGKIPFGDEQGLFVRSIETRAIDRAAEIGNEHALTLKIQCQSNSLHQVSKENLRTFASSRRCIHGRPVHSVTGRRITAVRPVDHPVGEIEIQIDRLRQLTEKELDIFATCRSMTVGNFQVCAEDAAFSGVVITLLGPVELSAFNVERHAHAPIFRVMPVGFAMAGLYERFELRTIKFRPHDSHAFSIRPATPAMLLIELELLGSKRASLGNNGRYILPVEIGAFDGAIVRFGVAHVGPVDVTGGDVNHDAIRKSSTLIYDNFQIQAIWI